MLLGLAGPPWHLTPLLFVALLPALLALLHERTTLWLAAAITAAIGLGQNVTLAATLQFPLAMGIGLVLALGVGWLALGVFVQPLANRLSTAATWVVVPAAFVVCEFASVVAVPMFGTALSFARLASAWPGLLSIASVAGFTGIVFVLALAQTAIVLAIWRRSPTAWIGLAAVAGGIAAVGGLVALHLHSAPRRV